MSRRRVFVPVPKAKLAQSIHRQPEFKAMLRENAEAVKDAAERETPIGEDERRGHVIHAYGIVELPTAMRVVNWDALFHLVEWGSANNPAYAPLRRGVLAAGLRFAEDSKGEIGPAGGRFAFEMNRQ